MSEHFPSIILGFIGLMIPAVLFLLRVLLPDSPKNLTVEEKYRTRRIIHAALVGISGFFIAGASGLWIALPTNQLSWHYGFLFIGLGIGAIGTIQLMRKWIDVYKVEVF